MNFDIRFIPHSSQRYPTVGDYWETPFIAFFRISRMTDQRYQWLVLIHEMVEYFLVKHAGISIQSIDEFDKKFEEKRKDRLVDMFEEPGDDREAPYYYQHQAATAVERLCALLLGVSWREYEEAVMAL